MTNNTATLLSSKVSLEILVNGRPITQHKHNNRVYAEGRSGSEYSIKVKNDNDVSVYAIISVDGISVIDGLQASENSIGFLIEKQSAITVPGWMITEKSAAKFKFSEIKNSYSEANNKDNVENIGVIGCIVIAEKVAEKKYDLNELTKKYLELQKTVDDVNKKNVPYTVPYPVYPYWEHRPYWYWNNGLNGWHNTIPQFTSICNNGYGSDSLSGGIGVSNISNNVSSAECINNFSFANTSNTMATGSLNSGDGYKGIPSCVNHITGEATFVKADSPLGTGFGEKTKIKDANLEKTFKVGEIIKSFVIYYDSRKNLEKLGIIFDKKKLEKKEPNPFPASKIKFCSPPEGWE